MVDETESFERFAEMVEGTLRGLLRLAEVEIDSGRVWVHDAEVPASYRPLRDGDPLPNEAICGLVVAVRQHMAAALEAVARDDADAAALHAWQAGAALAEGLPVIAGGPTAEAVQVGLKTRTQKRHFAQAGRGPRLDSAELAENVQREAEAIRVDKPLDKQHSTRWLAKKVARSLGKNEHTVRGHLKEQGIR